MKFVIFSVLFTSSLYYVVEVEKNEQDKQAIQTNSMLSDCHDHYVNLKHLQIVELIAVPHL